MLDINLFIYNFNFHSRVFDTHLAGGHLEDVDDAVDGAGGDVLPVGRVRDRQRELAAGVQHLMIRSIRQSSIFLVD